MYLKLFGWVKIICITAEYLISYNCLQTRDKSQINSNLKDVIYH